MPALLFAGAAPAAAQEPAWAAAQFACAVFAETRTTDLRSDVGGRLREETVRRDGVLVLEAEGTAKDGRLRLAAWYDSLALVRRNPEGTYAPDTDGVLGGRWRGLLTADGQWSALERPWVPDPVRDAADVAATMDDLLPRLPVFALRPGGTLTDTAGTRFERLADSAGALRRYVVRRRESQPTTVAGSPTTGTETRTSEARVVWDLRLGLLRLDRRSTVELNAPTGPSLREPVRAQADERLLLRRRVGARVEDCRPAPE